MRLSYVGLMSESEVEPPSVEMTAALAVTVTATIFPVPYSLLSFNLEENGFMKLLRASYSLNGISTAQYINIKG